MEARFRTFADLTAYLESRGLFHMDLSLDRITRVLEYFGLRTPNMPLVQVLGTNGKGSTATFVASLCAALGLSTGLYTSPHFCSPRERIQILGAKELSSEDWLVAANTIFPKSQDLTYFEFLTVLALFCFAKRHVDVGVLEAGLGGAHDATTAVACKYQIFTPIDLDHTAILGPTLLDIARDKFSAISPGATVVSATQAPECELLLAEMLRERGARRLPAPPLPLAYAEEIRLHGTFQRDNAALALALVKALAQDLGLPCPQDAILRGLANAYIPGRLQRVAATAQSPELLLDGAHNPHGMRGLVAALKDAKLCPGALVFSCLHDKDWRGVLTVLKQAFPGIPAAFPQLTVSRAEDASEVARFWYEGEPPTSHLPYGGPVWETISSLSETPVLVTGSLYLLAEVFTHVPMRPDENVVS